MSEVMLGIRVPPSLRQAAKLTAELNGKTTAEWLGELIERNLDPKAVSLFLTSDVQQKEQNQSDTQPAA